MSNLFDRDGLFAVLRNDIGEYSFWPAEGTVPSGWRVVMSAAPRADAEAYVREHWTTLTPSNRLSGGTP